MATIDNRKVLFFIVGTSPTANETAAMNRIRGKIEIRSLLQSTTYGSGLAESADAVAALDAADIPSAYSAYTDVTPTAVDQPEGFKVVPAAITIAASGTGALYAVGAELTEDTMAVAMTDESAASEVAWTSSNESVATVDTNGVVTNVSAGSATITATYTDAGSDTVTSTCAVTCSA